jgi:benzoate membrane transport protein
VRRLFAVPAAVLLAVGLIAATAHLPPGMAHALWPAPVLIPPGLSLPALVGITVPLFIVTMASQNIPGLAVLSLYGFRPDPGLTFRATGVASLLAAPFGAHAINLAAITAAISSGPDAHADPARRYWAAVVAGVGYVVLGLLAGAATAFISASPPILIEAVAGLALLGPGAAALHAAVALPSEREPAMVTFLVAASGLTILGIGAAFWGLLAGGALLALSRWRAGVAGPR